MKDDKFEMGTGQAHELAMAFGRNGWNNADIKKLSEGKTLERVLSVIRGKAEVKFPSEIFAAELIGKCMPDYLNYGGKNREWWVVEDVAPSLTPDKVSKLKSRWLRKKGEMSISGPEMLERAVKFRANWGLVDGKQMLIDNGKRIPRAEFGAFGVLLPGTILSNSDGYSWVACLKFFDGSWILDFEGLNSGVWTGAGRFACIR